MIHLGALVNLTDVHGSTPFMDVLSRKKPDAGVAGVALYSRICNLGKVIWSNFARSEVSTVIT